MSLIAKIRSQAFRYDGKTFIAKFLRVHFVPYKDVTASPSPTPTELTLGLRRWFSPPSPPNKTPLSSHLL